MKTNIIHSGKKETGKKIEIWTEITIKKCHKTD